MIMQETRRESYKAIKPKMGQRHAQCLQALKELGGQATANELARHFLKKGIISFYNTNFTNPRLNELRKNGLVEVIGKKKDLLSDRTVAIYSLVKREEQVN